MKTTLSDHIDRAKKLLAMYPDSKRIKSYLIRIKKARKISGEALERDE